jgi:type III secretion protein Q
VPQQRALEPTIRPFPWRVLEPLTRAEVKALRDVKFWTARHVALDRLTGVAREMLGAPVSVRIDRARPFRSLRPMDGGVGVVLAHAEDPVAERGVLVEAEGALVAQVVSRALGALGKTAPRLVEPGLPPTPSIAGAFAAVLVAASRRAHAEKALAVLRAGASRDLADDARLREAERWCVSLTVLLGDDAYAARVAVPSHVALVGSPAGWDRGALAALGPLPLTLSVVRCASRMTAAELATLRAQDALVLPPDPGGGVDSQGRRVWLAAPSAELGVCAELGEDGRLMLGGSLEPLVGAETDMASYDNDALTTALGDVPVVVRVEIGEAVMSARDWASLGRGDVVGLSRRVGGPVVLRVGGIPVARGELVELDGEVAVRILERLTGEDTAS